MPTAFNQEPELLLRRIIGPEDAEDYEIIHDGKAVGRLSRSGSGGRVSWQWSIYGATAGQRNNGIADSPSDAKAAFLSAWQGLLRGHPTLDATWELPAERLKKEESSGLAVAYILVVTLAAAAATPAFGQAVVPAAGPAAKGEASAASIPPGRLR